MANGQQTTDQQITGQQTTGQQITDQQITDQQITDQQITDQQITDQQITDQQITDQQTTQEQTTQEQSTTDESSETPERVVPLAAEYTLPEGIPAEFGKFANENGFTQEQVDASLLQFGLYLQANETHSKQALKEAGKTHMATWGKDSKLNFSLVQDALEISDPSGELTTLLNETGFGHHPVVLEYLYRQGTGYKEKGFLKSKINVPQKGKTLAQNMYGANHPSEAS